MKISTLTAVVLAVLVTVTGVSLFAGLLTPQAPALAAILVFGALCLATSLASAFVVVHSQPARVYRRGLRAGSHSIRS